MENTTSSSSRMQSMVSLYDLHSKFFLSAIEGIKDQDAHSRLDTQANHLAWIAGSLVDQRYEMAKDAGMEMPHASHEFFKDYKGIQDNITYPSLAQYKQEWEAISPVARKAITEVSDEKLNSIIDMGGMKWPLFDIITFTMYREANFIGQIALWRRLLGYEAMKYM